MNFLPSTAALPIYQRFWSSGVENVDQSRKPFIEFNLRVTGMTCPKCRTLNPVGRRSCHYCKYLFRENTVESSDGTKVAEVNQRLSMSSPIADVGAVETVRPMSAKTRKQEIDEHELIEYEQDPDSPTTFSPVGTTKTNSNRLALVIAVLIIVVAICGIAIYSQLDSAEEQTATILFSQAEQLFEDGKFSAALTSYQDFLDRYPDNDLVDIVDARIASLNTGLIEEEKMAIYHSERANILLEKAKLAFKHRQMVTPADDNAIAYINEIIEFDHDNAGAMALREDVIRHFKDEAEKSFSANHFKSARVYFDEILKLSPTDEYARGGILAIEKLDEKNVKKGRSKRSSRSTAKRTPTSRKKVPTQQKASSRTVKQPSSTPKVARKTSPNQDKSKNVAKKSTPQTKKAIPYETARVRTNKWAPLAGSIKKNVKVHRHTEEMLVLVQPGTKNYVVLTQRADLRADIYRGIYKDEDGNGQIAWMFGNRQMRSGIASTTRLAPFFTREFILSLRNPR